MLSITVLKSKIMTLSFTVSGRRWWIKLEGINGIAN